MIGERSSIIISLHLVHYGSSKSFGSTSWQKKIYPHLPKNWASSIKVDVASEREKNVQNRLVVFWWFWTISWCFFTRPIWQSGRPPRQLLILLFLFVHLQRSKKTAKIYVHQLLRRSNFRYYYERNITKQLLTNIKTNPEQFYID